MEHKKTFHQMMDDSQKAWHVNAMKEFRSLHKDLDLVQCYKLVSMAVKKYKK